MNEFSPISLIPDYSINPLGRILANSISIKTVLQNNYIVVGSIDGELYLYHYGIELPFKHTSGLGSISIVTISFISYFQKSVAVVITSDSKCYFFDLEEYEDEWTPIETQTLVFNASCCLIFEGKSGTEILIGTHHGGLGYFTADSYKPPKSIWRYSNNWNLAVEITALSLLDNTNILVGKGDGTTILFAVGENPERQQINSTSCENCSKDSCSILFKFNPTSQILGHVNAYGKLHLFQASGSSKNVSFSLISECVIGKRSTFINFLNGSLDDTLLVGCPDGTLYFYGKNKNFYRHEEPVQSYHFGVLEEPILAVVGQSGSISFFSKFELINNKIPRFLEFASADIEDLRKIIGDCDTPDEVLVSTYLYMPLS